MTRAKDDILQEIAREEMRLREFNRTREEALARIASLKSKLDAAPVPAPLPLHAWETSGNAPQTAAEKVSLFRSLFRGRPDVFPTRFVSKRTRRPGYSPACSNKWQAGLCALRTGGKCGECTNQGFIPVSDQVVLDHLQGRHVMDIYPLLVDETCWLLAADFDKRAWRDDVAAFRETCRIAEIPVARRFNSFSRTDGSPRYSRDRSAGNRDGERRRCTRTGR
jgi:hypothetical protein